MFFWYYQKHVIFNPSFLGRQRTKYEYSSPPTPILNYQHTHLMMMMIFSIQSQKDHYPPLSLVLVLKKFLIPLQLYIICILTNLSQNKNFYTQILYGIMIGGKHIPHEIYKNDNLNTNNRQWKSCPQSSKQFSMLVSHNAG